MSKLIIFDTETTGLEEEDKIIQVGAIIADLKDSTYSKVFDELCTAKDSIAIKIEAMATHGIREEQIKGKPLFVATDFLKELNKLNSEENYLIAHNLDFDLKMLEKEGFKHKLKLIDTLQCAKHLFEIGDVVNGYKVPNYKLQTFRYMMFTQDEEDTEAKKYGVEIKAHDAIGDVVILKMFLRKLILECTTQKLDRIENTTKKFKVFDKFKDADSLFQKERGKLKISKTIEEKIFAIMNIFNVISKVPTEVKIINFGKHKGKTLEEIDKIDQWYIDNYLYKEEKKKKDSKDPQFNKDMFYTLELIKKKRNINSKNSIDF